MQSLNEREGRQPFLLWLPKGLRLKLRISLLKKEKTITKFLTEACQAEVEKES